MKKGYLIHYGILGQKWGVKNGPPYPLSGGNFSESERRAKYKKRKGKNNIYNKKHFDTELDKDKDVLSTLSYNKDRTKNTDMFFAAYDKLDKHQYNALFNHKIPETVYDENGNEIGTNMVLKYRINTKLKNNIKVASEDSGANIFKKLYKNNRDFYNFVTDPDRMMSLYPKDRYLFKGYRESMDVIKKINANKDYVPSAEEIQKIYRLFNYVIPNDGSGNQRVAKDVLTQRTKFFNECKKEGYGAILDTNDAIYGGFKAKAPVIVFDMDSLITDEIKRTKSSSRKFSQAVLVGRKLFNALPGGDI